MKNITITLPEETAHWLRIWAAHQNMSVSSALASLIENLRQNKEMRLAAAECFFKIPAQSLSSEKPYPMRESLYER